ncbi:hypothetical protein Tco_0905473 [Tanacetum coccineum]
MPQQSAKLHNQNRLLAAVKTKRNVLLSPHWSINSHIALKFKKASATEVDLKTYMKYWIIEFQGYIDQVNMLMEYGGRSKGTNEHTSTLRSQVNIGDDDEQ